MRSDPMPKVTFLPKEVTIEVKRGMTLLGAANRADIPVAQVCLGNILCGTCVADIRAGAEHLSRASKLERRVLKWMGAREGQRLCCQCRIYADVVVHIPKSPVLDIDWSPDD